MLGKLDSWNPQVLVTHDSLFDEVKPRKSYTGVQNYNTTKAKYFVAEEKFDYALHTILQNKKWKWSPLPSPPAPSPITFERADKTQRCCDSCSKHE